MKVPVRLLRRAQNDLLEIRAYVSRESPAAAGRLVDRLLEALESLGEHPHKGPLMRDPLLRARGFRHHVVANYLVFYKSTRALVRIYRVIQAKRDYKRLL